MPVLGGVTLGEDAFRVMRRLGMHPPGWGTDGKAKIQIRIFPAGCGDLVMGLAFDTKIHSIIVRGSGDPKGQCADPGGIHVGDSVARLVSERGSPDDNTNVQGDDVFRYGPANGIQWRYEIHDANIVEIELSDGT